MLFLFQEHLLDGSPDISLFQSEKYLKPLKIVDGILNWSIQMEEDYEDMDESEEEDTEESEEDEEESSEDSED